MRQPTLRFISFIGLGIIAILSVTLFLSSNFQGSFSATAQPPNQAGILSGNLKSVSTTNKAVPQAIIVNSLRGKGIITLERGNQFPAKPGIQIVNNRRLGIPGSEKRNTGSNLGFMSQFKQRIKGYIAAAGFSKVSSEYHYPCLARGSFAVGWQSGLGGQGCGEVQYSSTGKPTKIGPKSLKANDSFEPQKHEIGAPVNRDQFCSVASLSKEEWWDFKLASFNATKDTCQQAIEECQKHLGDTCFVTSRGDWRDYDPDANDLNLLLRCANDKQYYHQIVGRRLEERDVYKFAEELKRKAQAENAYSCIFNIYSNNQVLISPSSNQRTLVHTDGTDDGFVINDLVGSVTIRASENLEKGEPVELQPGESYRFRDSLKRGRKESLTAIDCKNILTLPVVREFLDVNKWYEEIKPEVPQYQKALDEQFYQPLPALANPLEGGVDGWIATIDLSRPGASLAVERNPGGNFNSYASGRKLSVIMGGIYRYGKWTLKSGGKYISRGEQWGKRYTVLGLDENNQLEIVTQTDLDSQPRWEQYQVAVQAGPRLVRKGTATITVNSARSEGHTTLNITSNTRRSGLGISRDRTKLFYVVASNVSLQRLAEIMVSNGSYEAMALDGGNGPALAYNGSVKESPGEAQPYFILANQIRTSGTTARRGCQE